MVAPGGVVVNVVLSCCPTGRFRLNTVGWAALSTPSLMRGLPISRFRVSAATATGAEGAAGVVSGGTGAGGVGGTGLATTGGRVLAAVGTGAGFVPPPEGASDRLMRKIGRTIRIDAAVAELIAMPHGVLKIPRRGFCGGGWSVLPAGRLPSVDCGLLSRDNGVAACPLVDNWRSAVCGKRLFGFDGTKVPDGNSAAVAGTPTKSDTDRNACATSIAD